MGNEAREIYPCRDIPHACGQGKDRQKGKEEEKGCGLNHVEAGKTPAVTQGIQRGGENVRRSEAMDFQ